jgi:dsDNA-specific endonuclease/ATPase MutS2
MDAKTVIANFATTNENGEVISFNLEGLDALISELRAEAKEIRTANKVAAKAQQDANKVAAAEAGKEYYSALKIGDEFEVIINGKPAKVVKIATKSKDAKTAACSLVEWNETMGKTPNRYPSFDKVVIA